MRESRQSSLTYKCLKSGQPSNLCSLVSESIWFGSRVNIANMKGRDCSVRFGSQSITPSTIAQHLGVYLDQELTIKQHVAKVAASCFYHLRRLRQIQRVGTEVTRIITSRLDYCNSLQSPTDHVRVINYSFVSYNLYLRTLVMQCSCVISVTRAI